MPPVPYLIFEKQPHDTYKFLCINVHKNLPEDAQVEDILDHAVSCVSTEILGPSQQVAKVPSPLAYVLVNPISALIGRPDAESIEELGVVDNAFLIKSTVRWHSTMAFPANTAKMDGKILVILTLTHTRSTLASIPEHESQDGTFSREEVADAAGKRVSPSAGAHNSTLITTQKDSKPDAIYNGRPLVLTAPPIEIYHPIFATFRRKMSQSTSEKFSATELEQIYSFMTKSVAFYDNKGARRDQLDVLRNIVHPSFLVSRVLPTGNGKSFLPDGVGVMTCENLVETPLAAIFFTELKNGIGEGGSDPISQSQCDYLAFYSAVLRKPLRDLSCCPAFLIGIAGPYLIIAGAVFTDRFISQNLTDYLYLGGSPFVGPRVHEIGKVFRVLKECLTDLEKYYSELTPHIPRTSEGRLERQPLRTSQPSTAPLYPHFKRFTHVTTGRAVELEYTHRLLPQFADKAVFKAHARSPGSHEISTVVVKFTPTYCKKAHDLLQKNSLAPRLWLCKKEEAVGMYVVVMDFIPGRQLGGTQLSGEDVVALREALRILHDNDLVYGDFRSPNIILPAEGKPMFIDFDWSGRAGEVTYPPDINLDPSIGWHQDVRRGGLIHREHDVFMLECLEKGTNDG